MELYQQEAIRARNYELKRYLSASLASRAGFSISLLVEKQLDGIGEGDPLSFVGDSLPEDPSSDNLSDIASAIEILEQLPQSFLIPKRAQVPLQLSFYQAAYSLMYLKRFDQRSADGSLDRERLDSMSDADAEAILDNLEALAAGEGTKS